MADSDNVALQVAQGRRPRRLRPLVLAAGLLLSILGAVGIGVPAALSFLIDDPRSEVLLLGIGTELFAGYAVCLMMVGVALVFGAFRVVPRAPK